MFHVSYIPGDCSVLKCWCLSLGNSHSLCSISCNNPGKVWKLQIYPTLHNANVPTHTLIYASVFHTENHPRVGKRQSDSSAKHIAKRVRIIHYYANSSFTTAGFH